MPRSTILLVPRLLSLACMPKQQHSAKRANYALDISHQARRNTATGRRNLAGFFHVCCCSFHGSNCLCGDGECIFYLASYGGSCFLLRSSKLNRFTFSMGQMVLVFENVLLSSKKCWYLAKMVYTIMLPTTDTHSICLQRLFVFVVICRRTVISADCHGCELRIVYPVAKFSVAENLTTLRQFDLKFFCHWKKKCHRRQWRIGCRQPNHFHWKTLEKKCQEQHDYLCVMFLLCRHLCECVCVCVCVGEHL